MRSFLSDKIVEKIVEREQIVEVPVDRVVKNEVPVYVSAELHKTGEVQHFQPVYIDRVVEKDVPVFVDKIIPSEKAVPVVNEVQVLVRAFPQSYYFLLVPSVKHPIRLCA